MSYIGTVKNGVVELPPESKLRGDQQVQVSPLVERKPMNERTRRLLEIAATMPPLPSDFAGQHDHYIHGKPKR